MTVLDTLYTRSHLSTRSTGGDPRELSRAASPGALIRAYQAALRKRFSPMGNLPVSVVSVLSPLRLRTALRRRVSVRLSPLSALLGGARATTVASPPQLCLLRPQRPPRPLSPPSPGVLSRRGPAASTGLTPAFPFSPGLLWCLNIVAPCVFQARGCVWSSLPRCCWEGCLHLWFVTLHSSLTYEILTHNRIYSCSAELLNASTIQFSFLRLW